jgi:hypothetical protein
MRRGPPAPEPQAFAEENTMKKLMIFVVGSYTLLMLASLVFAQAGAAKLAAEKCSACHSTARICDRLGNRTLEVWQQTALRMKGNGAKITEAEAASIAEYLATAKPGSKPLCQ